MTSPAAASSKNLTKLHVICLVSCRPHIGIKLLFELRCMSTRGHKSTGLDLCDHRYLTSHLPVSIFTATRNVTDPQCSSLALLYSAPVECSNRHPHRQVHLCQTASSILLPLALLLLQNTGRLHRQQLAHRKSHLERGPSPYPMSKGSASVWKEIGWSPLLTLPSPTTSSHLLLFQQNAPVPSPWWQASARECYHLPST